MYILYIYTEYIYIYIYILILYKSININIYIYIYIYIKYLKYGCIVKPVILHQISHAVSFFLSIPFLFTFLVASYPLKQFLSLRVSVSFISFLLLVYFLNLVCHLFLTLLIQRTILFRKYH